MKRLNKKTYKAIKQAKAVITITQHGDVVKFEKQQDTQPEFADSL